MLDHALSWNGGLDVITFLPSIVLLALPGGADSELRANAGIKFIRLLRVLRVFRVQQVRGV